MILLSTALVPESIGYEFLAKCAGHGPLGNAIAFFIDPTFFFALIVWLLIGITSLVVAKRAKMIPGTFQTAVESIFQFVFELADDMIGPKAPKYYPLFIGLFVFILVSNLIGLIPGLISPTSNPMLPFGFAIMIFIYYNYIGIRTHGIKYFKQFLGPSLPLYMLPIRALLIVVEGITFFVKPFSLGLRLFCNIFSKELFLAVLAMLVIQFLTGPTLVDKIFTLMPLVLRPVILLLGLILGLIQAFVFTVLSISYIAGALHAEEH